MPHDARAKAIDPDSAGPGEATPRGDRPFEELTVSVALGLGRLGITPNALTYASFAPAAAAIFATATGNFVPAVLLMLLSGVCDFLDGPLARSSGKTSRYGALLDSTLDRFSDAAPLIGLCVFYSDHGWACLVPAATLFAAYTVSYVRARAEGLGIALPPLWMRRTERMVLIGGALLLAPLNFGASTLPAPVTLGVIAMIGLLSMAASTHALVEAARILKPEEGENMRRRFKRPQQ